MLIELEVLIPRRDNQGRRFPEASWRELEQRLRHVAGGFSREDRIVGQWASNDTLYRDVSQRYTVAIKSWRQFPSWLDVMEWARAEFRQEAIYIRVHGRAEILGGQQ